MISFFKTNETEFGLSRTRIFLDQEGFFLMMLWDLGRVFSLTLLKFIVSLQHRMEDLF
jgi:hypothetical protein